MSPRHVPTDSGQCAYCGEVYPCATATARDAIVKATRTLVDEKPDATKEDLRRLFDKMLPR